MNDVDIDLRSVVRLSSCVDIVSVNGGGICDVSPNTLRWLNQSINSLIGFAGDIPAGDMDPAILQMWHKDNLARVSVISANGYLRAVKVVYSRLMSRGVIIYNPAAFVPFSAEPVRNPRAMLESTYGALRAAAGVRNLAILDILWASGCRLGGLVTMSLQALELWHDNGRPCLAVQVTEKFDRSRFVYAAGDPVRSMINWLSVRPSCNHSAIFVTSAGKPLKTTSISSIMRKLRIAANIPAGVPANAHAMRHAFAIRQLDNGVDLATVAAWLGHSDPLTTAKIYAIRREDQLRARYFSSKA